MIRNVSHRARRNRKRKRPMRPSNRFILVRRPPSEAKESPLAGESPVAQEPAGASRFARGGPWAPP